MLKSIIVTLSFTLIFSVRAYCQDYLPFPTENAVWYTMYSQPEPDPPYVTYYTTKFEVIGDTIINNKTYHKLYWGISYIGAYRTEPTNLKVYYIHQWDTDEYLVYDFNLIEGDTITIRNYNYICTGTDSILLNNGISHKVQYMLVQDNNNCMQTWVSGIGSLGIPFLEPYWGCGYTFELSYNLTCFYYNNELLYEWDSNPYFSGCTGSNTGIGLDDYVLNKLKIAPNPVEHVSKILAPNMENLLVNYQVTDIAGRIIFEYSNVSILDVEIRNDEFDPGVYFLKISSNNSRKEYILKFLTN